MSTFKDIAEGDDLSVFFNTDEHASDVLYNSVSIPAVVDIIDRVNNETGAMKRQRTIWVKVSDVAAPEYRDTVVIGSTTWRVGPVDDHEGDGITWELPLYRDERPRYR